MIVFAIWKNIKKIVIELNYLLKYDCTSHMLLCNPLLRNSILCQLKDKRSNRKNKTTNIDEITEKSCGKMLVSLISEMSFPP